MRPDLQNAAIAVLCVSLLFPIHGRAAGLETADIQNIVTRAIQPIMQRYGVPGMAVGIVTQGQSHVYVLGVASKATGRPVTSDTLFEIGSVSKTFTATLASYARVTGKLSLSDMASQYLPSLRGSSFDTVSLLNLGTHTSGGLPSQVPNDITNDAQLMAYFQNWKPDHAPGTSRKYGNPGIGLLGVIAAKSMNQDFVARDFVAQDFVALMRGTLFPALSLKNTYLDVPESQMENYARGYTTADTPIRMKPGPLGAEAYGIRTTAGDLLRFVEANMSMLDLDETWRRAIAETHTGYYRIEAMTQDLIWEQYDYPLELAKLLAGNAAGILNHATPATALDPPLPPRDDVLIDKTGSTNGFGTYVAFVPAKAIGIVLLANKDYPIDARVTAAYEILTLLEDRAPND